MAKYLALQIYKGSLYYDEVIEKYSQFKAAIDKELEKLQEPLKSDAPIV